MGDVALLGSLYVIIVFQIFLYAYSGALLEERVSCNTCNYFDYAFIHIIFFVGEKFINRYVYGKLV